MKNPHIWNFFGFGRWKAFDPGEPSLHRWWYKPCINVDTEVSSMNAIEFKFSFKLVISNSNLVLGITIDHNIFLIKYVDRLKSTVNQKLYSIKRLFYLSLNIKVQFIKTFIQLHFDYCSTLAIYFNKTLVNRIERFYNICLFRLTGIPFITHSLTQQIKNLKPYKIRCSISETFFL